MSKKREKNSVFSYQRVFLRQEKRGNESLDTNNPDNAFYIFTSIKTLIAQIDWRRENSHFSVVITRKSSCFHHYDQLRKRTEVNFNKNALLCLMKDKQCCEMALLWKFPYKNDKIIPPSTFEFPLCAWNESSPLFLLRCHLFGTQWK